MKTFANKIIEFNKSLEFKGKLPEGIRIMNPFQENENIISISTRPLNVVAHLEKNIAHLTLLFEPKTLTL